MQIQRKKGGKKGKRRKESLISLTAFRKEANMKRKKLLLLSGVISIAVILTAGSLMLLP